MKKLCIFTFSFIAVVPTVLSYGQNIERNDLHLLGFTSNSKNNQIVNSVFTSNDQYTLLDAAQYQLTVLESRMIIDNMINDLNVNKNLDFNKRVDFIAKKFMDIPYGGAVGEGDWKPSSKVYKSDAAHVKQDPVYRMDGLNCQTFIQVMMGILFSNTLDEFDENFLRISYGAAGNPSGDIVRYFNRNNFIDGDWNPVNNQNGYLKDVTGQDGFNSIYKIVHSEINRGNWFALQEKYLKSTVRVLDNNIGPMMSDRYLNLYTHLDYPHFDKEVVEMSYLPKSELVIKHENGKYSPNKALLDKLPTPSVLEIVRDPKQWIYEGENIKDAIGSELSISHMGILYRKTFKKGDVIYQKIKCAVDSENIKKCSVTPIKCAKNSCAELMFLHASNAWPNGYYWYKNSNNEYACTATLPKNVTRYTSCNRVLEQPLSDYITDFQYGRYRYMDTPSILGIHLEKILLGS